MARQVIKVSGKVLVLCAFLLIFATVTPARARLMEENVRLDRALPDPEAIVVAGFLIPAPFLDNPWERRMPPHGVSFSVRIDHVLQGTANLYGAILVYDDLNFYWPNELVQIEADSFCVLILRDSATGDPSVKNPFRIISVLPADQRDLPNTADVEELQRMLVKQVVKKLPDCTSPSRQSRLIAHAIRFMTAKEAQALIPFLGSEDERVRRAALAGLAYATQEDRYIRRAAEDIDDMLRFFAAECAYRRNGREGAPPGYYSLFHCYFFLKPNLRVGEEARLVALLPLFRAVADNYCEDFDDEIWDYGLEPLCLLGVRQDVATLYVHRNDTYPERRRQVVRAISRILDLGFPEYKKEEFLKHESELQEKVRDALEREEILPKKKH